MGERTRERPFDDEDDEDDYSSSGSFSRPDPSGSVEGGSSEFSGSEEGSYYSSESGSDSQSGSEFDDEDESLSNSSRTDSRGYGSGHLQHHPEHPDSRGTRGGTSHSADSFAVDSYDDPTNSNSRDDSLQSTSTSASKVSSSDTQPESRVVEKRVGYFSSLNNKYNRFSQARQLQNQDDDDEYHDEDGSSSGSEETSDEDDSEDENSEDGDSYQSGSSSSDETSDSEEEYDENEDSSQSTGAKQRESFFDELRQRRFSVENRKKLDRGLTIFCVVFAIALALGIGLGVGLKDTGKDRGNGNGGDDDNIGSLPTLAPTVAPPVAIVPNATDDPDAIELADVRFVVEATGDTTIVRDNEEDLFEEFPGNATTMLVQNYNGDNTDVRPKSAYSLVELSVESQQLKDVLPDFLNATFCLDHVIHTDRDPEIPATYATCLVRAVLDEETNAGANVLSTAGSVDEWTQATNGVLVLPDDCFDQTVVEFDVLPIDERVCVDVTPLIRAARSGTSSNNNNPTLQPPPPTNRQRGLRGSSTSTRDRSLQPLEGLVNATQQQRLVLMIDSVNATDQPGDRFYTSEIGNVSETIQPPSLTIEGKETVNCTTIADVVCSDPRFSVLCSMLRATGNDLVLDDYQSTFTLFAPTNEALVRSSLVGDGSGSLVQGGGQLGPAVFLETCDDACLTRLLLDHAINGAPALVLSTSIECGFGNTTYLIMASGQTAMVECLGGIFYVAGDGNDINKFVPPKVIDVDIAVCNGVLHAIDGVILSLDDESLDNDDNNQTVLIGEIDVDEEDCQSFDDVVCSEEELSALCEMVVEPGEGPLVSELLATFEISSVEFTAFLPSNEATDSFLDDADASNRKSFEQILSHHVMLGQSLLAKDLGCGRFSEMIFGGDTQTVCDGDDLFQAGQGNPASSLPRLVATDIQTCTGVVHIVDRLILPESKFQPVPPIIEVAEDDGEDVDDGDDGDGGSDDEETRCPEFGTKLPDDCIGSGYSVGQECVYYVDISCIEGEVECIALQYNECTEQGWLIEATGPPSCDQNQIPNPNFMKQCDPLAVQDDTSKDEDIPTGNDSDNGSEDVSGEIEEEASNEENFQDDTSTDEEIPSEDGNEDASGEIKEEAGNEENIQDDTSTDEEIPPEEGNEDGIEDKEKQQEEEKDETEEDVGSADNGGFVNTEDDIIAASLKDFYIGTNGANWDKNDNWNSDEDFCTWHGIKCDKDERVTELVLKDNGLTGTIPTSIGLLTDLVLINLASNDLTGKIPNTLDSLRFVKKLKLWDNRLTGTIPYEILGMESLTVLEVQKNQLTGAMPSCTQNTPIEYDTLIADCLGDDGIECDCCTKCF